MVLTGLEKSTGVISPAGASDAKPYAWVINPVVDFLFVYGGAVWIFLALNYLFLGWTAPALNGGSAGRTLLIIAIIAQHLFGNSHNFATYMRIYGSADDFKQFKFYATWLAWLCLPLFIAGVTVPGAAGTFVYLYILTVFWHYTMQSFGICLIYCSKQGYKLEKWETETFRWFSMSLSAYIPVRAMSFITWSPKYAFGLECPFWGPLPFWVFESVQKLLLLCSILLAGVVVKKLFLEKKLPPFPVVLSTATICTIAFAYGRLDRVLWLWIPAFFHGSQYMAVSLSYYLKERGLGRGMDPSKIGAECLTKAAFKYMALAVLLGVFFYVGLPRIFGSCGYSETVIVAVVLAVVNFHHFATDAAIWKLRDPRCRKILVS